MRWPICFITSMPELLERCPACRARLGESAVCPRCGCDFALVRLAEQQAERVLAQAIRAFAVGDLVAAREHISRSLASNRLRLAQALALLLDADDQGSFADSSHQPRGHRFANGAREFGPHDEWLPCADERLRRQQELDEKDGADPQTGIAGASGADGRQDAGGPGPAVRHSPESDHEREAVTHAIFGNSG